MNDNPILYSPHAEESVIGATLVNPRILDSVNLSPSDFYITRHAWIWDALQTIHRSGMTPDFVTLGAALDASGRLAEIGGPAYLAKLVNDVPFTMGGEDYAKIVKDHAARRRLLEIAGSMARLAYDKDHPLDEGMAGIMTDISQISYAGEGAVHWKFYLNQAYDFLVERAEHPGGIWGIPTGFRDFDVMTGGLQLAELLLVTGDAGAGKSMFVMQLAQQVAAGKRSGALYSLEMLGKSVGVRALSSASMIPSRTMKMGKLTDDQWPVLAQAIEIQESFPIYMSDKTNWTTAGLRSDLARLKQLYKIQWFIVDYSYLLADGVGTLSETDRTQIIISAMKNVCKDLQLAGIVIHSKNKLGELRGSGQVKYDADIILDLSIPDELHPENIRCTFTKGRELDEQNKYFDLCRMQGIPRYETGTEHTINLNESWVHN